MKDIKSLNKMPKSRNVKDKFRVFLLFSIILTSLCCFPFFNYLLENPQSDSNDEASDDSNDESNDHSKLPIVYINCSDNITAENYVNCMFELNYKDSPQNEISLDSKIKFRGTSVFNLPKKGYRLEFYKKVSLLGMRKDDDWYLFANYMDHTRMRVKLSFDMWRSLQELDHEMAILPESEYVRLFINNKFQGLYLLAEKNDRKLFELDQSLNDLDSSLIFQTKSPTSLEEYDRRCWEQDWPNPEDLDIMDEILPDLIDFINNTPNKEFFNDTMGIYSKFDKINLIDFFLFNFFSLHIDFWNKNYFLIRDTAPSKFYLIPWDFDGSFGQWGWVLYNPYINRKDIIQSKNAIYRRLLDNDKFKEDCIDRWNELREELWTEEFILDKLDDIYEEIKDILKNDMEMWKPITVDDEPEDKYPDKYIYSTKEFDLKEYIDYLYDWIEERLDFCDSFFAK